MRRLASLLGDPRVVWAAVACAFALRVWYGLRFFPRPLVGDENWYVETATLLARDGLGAAGAEFYIRPPGTTFWIAGVFALFGAGNVPAVVIANALLTSCSVWLVAAVARAVMPRVGWAPAVLACVQVVNPWELVYTGALTSEALAMPLTLLYVLACVGASSPPTWRRVLATGVAGALLVHVRVDCLPVVVAAPVWSLVSAWRHGSPRAAAAGRWTAAAALALLLCVPWSVHLASRLGHTAFLYSGSSRWLRGNDGWAAWLSDVSLRQEHWIPLLWFPQQVGSRTLSADAFDTPDEEAEVRSLLARARAAGDLTPEMNDRFRELGAARRARHPLRFYVWLPVERSARLWLDVTDRRYGVRGEYPPLSVLQQLARAWRHLFSVLAALGFISCFWFAFRLRSGVCVVGVVVLVRTYSLLLAGPVVNGVATFESRYLANVDSLALVVLAAAVAAVSSRRTPPGGSRADAA